MLDEKTLAILFREARSQNGFLAKPVSRHLLVDLYDLLKMGPTSANCSPIRIIFLTTAVAKARLIPALNSGNVEKTLSAPVVAILGYDLRFYQRVTQLFPHRPTMYDGFADSVTLAESTAIRNGTLQAAYLLIAARALGLDCGPMSGFDESAVNRQFFPDGHVRVNFLCNLGYGDSSKVFPRLPRLPFDDACSIQ